DRLDELIEASRFELGSELMGSLDQLEAYARDTSSNLIALAARVLDWDAPAPAFAGPAGVSMALAGLLRRFALDAARGQLFLPADLLVQHAVVPQDVFAGQSSDGLVASLAHLRDVAARHYEEARVLTPAGQTA